MTSPLTILLARETTRDGPVQLSTNHLARAIAAQGHRTLWMTRPLTPISLLGRAGRASFVMRADAVIDNWRANPGPQICVASILARKKQIGLTGSWLLRNLFRYTVPSVRSALTRRGVEEVDVLWLSDPIQVGLIDRVPHKRLVFQVTDDYRAFANYGHDVSRELGTALAASDLVLFTNAALRDAYISYFELAAERCHYVSHGVGRPNIKADVELTEPIEAVYVGAINDWLDWDWLDALVAALPKLRITFYGPCAPGYSGRLAHPAFRYGGVVQPDRLPDLLPPFHFGLIPFRGTALKRFSEPMKLYDYVAGGLPVVSLLDLDRRIVQGLPAGIRIVDDAETAAQWMDRDAAFYELMRGTHARDCRRFVLENSWDRRAATVTELLAQPMAAVPANVVPFKRAACG